LKTSHVLPALIRKFHEAKVNGDSFVEIWGSGNVFREFMHVDDMASASIFLMKNYSAKEISELNISHINAGTGEELTIKELAFLVKDIIGFIGDIRFDPQYPDGMPRKLLDISRLSKMGWNYNIKLKDGIKSVYNWYIDNN
jgi:Nucleoside-diphosphate-sugar epimerases